MNPKLEGQIYNYRTGQHDPLAEGELFTLDDEKLADYVPQMGGAGDVHDFAEDGTCQKCRALIRAA